jgi:hypothetical protein
VSAVGLLNQRSDAFADQNVFLHFVLGVASASRRFDEVLERLTTGRTRSREARGAPGDPEAGEGGEADEVLYFVLGLASLRARAGVYIEALRSPRPPPEASVDAAAAHSRPGARSGLLR